MKNKAELFQDLKDYDISLPEEILSLAIVAGMQKELEDYFINLYAQ
jgi:hypothetical protein